MRIKTLTLFSNDLESQKKFYTNTLGFKLAHDSSGEFSLTVGWSTLNFKKTKEKYHYHYCFLLPSDKLEKAHEWFDNRLNIVKHENQSIIESVSWNAKSFYFYDGNGNIAECSVRYNLDYRSSANFSIADLLCINEIGTTTSDIRSTNEMLESHLGSYFWKGNKERFGTNGSEEGLFLLVNNKVKKVWFPTTLPTQPAPFEAEIETKSGTFEISYSNQKLKINKKSLSTLIAN